MEVVQTYQESFEPVIDALAEILEQRDSAYDDFIKTGANIVVEIVSDRGAVNERKNPRLQVWMDLNTQALQYWRDCGLTAAGLKKINEAAVKSDKQVSTLEEALKKLSSG